MPVQATARSPHGHVTPWPCLAPLTRTCRDTGATVVMPDQGKADSVPRKDAVAAEMLCQRHRSCTTRLVGGGMHAAAIPPRPAHLPATLHCPWPPHPRRLLLDVAAAADGRTRGCVTGTATHTTGSAEQSPQGHAATRLDRHADVAAMGSPDVAAMDDQGLTAIPCDTVTGHTTTDAFLLGRGATHNEGIWPAAARRCS